MQSRYEIGVVDRIGLTSVEVVVRQYEGQLNAHERRLEIRQAFLAGELTAVEAELRVLEVEAEERAGSMRQQMEILRRELEARRQRR